MVFTVRNGAQMGFLKAVFLFLRAWFASKSNLAAENLALRQQLAVMNQTAKRPKLRHRDRVFWTWLMRLWPNWRSALLVVKPETVIRWHREGFRRYWHRKSHGSSGDLPLNWRFVT